MTNESMTALQFTRQQVPHTDMLTYGDSLLQHVRQLSRSR